MGPSSSCPRSSSSDAEVPFLRKEPAEPLMQASKSLKPKATTKVTRKIRGCDIQRLWSEQSKIREEIEAGRPYQVQGLLQMELQLSKFMAELEAKHANAESVILDLAKELVRTAQEVENINCQGASVEERLEQLELKMRQSAPSYTLEDSQRPKADFDGLFHLDLATAATGRRSPSEVANRPPRREVATWSGYEAPGELISKAKEKLTARPQTSQTLPVMMSKASSVDHRKLFESAASKAIADAFNEASLQLRALSSELMSSMQKATTLDIEAKKKDLGSELQMALESLRSAAEVEAAAAVASAPATSAAQPEAGEAGLTMPSNQVAATTTGENFCGSSTAGQESPKTRVAKRRPSQRILGALACFGVVRPADDDR
eukprot:s935_g18.t1